MYLSSLQKFILKTALSNLNSESLTLYSDAQESSIVKSKNKTDSLKKKTINLFYQWISKNQKRNWN